MRRPSPGRSERLLPAARGSRQLSASCIRGSCDSKREIVRRGLWESIAYVEGSSTTIMMIRCTTPGRLIWVQTSQWLSEAFFPEVLHTAYRRVATCAHSGSFTFILMCEAWPREGSHSWCESVLVQPRGGAIVTPALVAVSLIACVSICQLWYGVSASLY